MPGPDARNDCDFLTPVLLPGDPLGLLHEQGPEALVLELGGVPVMDRDNGAVNMQLSHHAAPALDLRPKRVLAQLPQPQQADQNVLLRVLIRNKRLPGVVRVIIPPNELNLLRLHLVMHLLNPDLPRPHITTGDLQFLHPGQYKFPQVPVVNARGDDRHRDVPLHSVHPQPGRGQGHQLGHDIDQLVRVVAAVLAVLPQLVQACAPDHERRVDLQPVRAELRVLEQLAKALEVALEAHVGQVGHDVGHDFVAAVLGHREALLDRLDCVAAVGVPGDVLEDTLHADLEPRAAVVEQVVEVRLVAVVRPGLDGDAHALGVALLAELRGLGHVLRGVPGERVVQVADEVVSVVGREGHEGPAHDHELDFVDVVAELLQLLHPVLGLDVGVVPGADGPHRGRLVARVGLGGVLEVAVRPAGAVDANVACGRDVRAAVRLRHHSHDGHPGGRPDRLGLEDRRQGRLVLFGDA